MKPQPLLPYFYFFLFLFLLSLGSCQEKNEPVPDNTPGTLIDVDGNIYPTVQIGKQRWMAENLKTTKYRDGSAIEYPGNDTILWQNNTTGAYAWQYDYEIDKDLYGGLYNWYAVNNSAGLCPTGWRVSTTEDWVVLLKYLQDEHGLSNDTLGIVGNSLKSCRQVESPKGGECNTTNHPRWEYNAWHSGSDDFGFAAFPGGRRCSDGIYSWMGLYGLWWAYDKSDTGSDARYRYINSDQSRVYGYLKIDKKIGLSVRCVKNS